MERSKAQTLADEFFIQQFQRHILTLQSQAIHNIASTNKLFFPVPETKPSNGSSVVVGLSFKKKLKIGESLQSLIWGQFGKTRKDDKIRRAVMEAGGMEAEVSHLAGESVSYPASCFSPIVIYLHLVFQVGSDGRIPASNCKSVMCRVCNPDCTAKKHLWTALYK